jgi:Fe-S-cluster containining protein
MNYVQRVEELQKLPQELCKTCGLCCKIATFKWGLTFEEVKALANNKFDVYNLGSIFFGLTPEEVKGLSEKIAEPSQVDGAKDFLTIFEPITYDEARETSPEFFEITTTRSKGIKAEIGFFKCRFIGDGNLCLIHEDRPLLCRMYPIPHARTFYHASCGFKEQGQKNWQEIEKIILILQAKSREI